ncbi:hypothetical protein KFL_004740070 [Klebsormidium nitens]|uniref:Uncharacterized protein n=1 Tax=Klebsormidium nitens TaxID=105231 RepID=A0A1Y1IJZ3_KLENI|nr:hypothetical protein KFL_004740070 [Klebsormidium nitens]|eukprot:GAQ88967.1 hypothetical protein KFL_004740070 [Klebsormidium nitens]
MAPRKRGAASKKEHTQVLPGRLGEKDQQELAVGLIDRYGGRQSKEAGIDLENGGDAALEQWFLLSVLFSRGISAGQVVNTYKVLTEGGIKNVSDAGKLEYHALWDKLSEGKAQRRDRTTKQLQSLTQVLQDQYAGSVRQLLTSSEDPHEVRASVEALPYMGPTTAELFLRDLKELYPQVKDVLDVSERALEAAQHLGLVSKIARTNKRQKGADSDGQKAQSPVKATDVLEELAKASGVDCRDLETALIKLHNGHYRGYAKCPGGMECAAAQTDGAKKEQDGEQTAAKAEEAPAAGAVEKKPADADVSMEEAADVSKEKPAETGEKTEAAPAKEAEEAPADVTEEKPAEVDEDVPAAEDAEPALAPADESKEAPADVSTEAEEKAPKEKVAGDGGSKEQAPEGDVAEKGDQGEGANGKVETEAAAEGEAADGVAAEGTEAAGTEAQPEEEEKKSAPNGGAPKQENGPGVEEKEAPAPSDVPRLEDEGAREQRMKKEAPRAADGVATELKAGA